MEFFKKISEVNNEYLGWYPLGFGSLLPILEKESFG